MGECGLIVNPAGPDMREINAGQNAELSVGRGVYVAARSNRIRIASAKMSCIMNVNRIIERSKKSQWHKNANQARRPVSIVDIYLVLLGPRTTASEF